jgi:CoA:oxalate CoA-transferase
VSMLDSVLVTMGWIVSNYLIAGQDPQPMGNDNFTAAPSGTFRTGDGLLNIAANKQEQFELLARAIGREELIADPRFAARENRKRHRAELTVAIEEGLAQRAAAEWEAVLSELGVPAGRVLSVPEALANPQVQQRGLLQSFEVPGLDHQVTVTRAGFKIAGAEPTVQCPPPLLGERTDAVLAGLGYSEEEIAQLRKDGAI